MKLVYAIINSDDSNRTEKVLVNNNFRVTKLASTGGFLKVGNTTFLICVEDDKVDEVIEIIKENSKTKKEFIPSMLTNVSASLGTFPVEVTVGGATIFVTDIERFEKV